MVDEHTFGTVALTAKFDHLGVTTCGFTSPLT